MKPAWTLACQLCRSARSVVTAHGTECDLPSSECVSYIDLAGHSLLPILFSQLWFRQSQRSQRNSFMESVSKRASNVQKDSLQWTSDTVCAETTDTENSISWASKRFWLFCFLPWSCLSAHIPSAISSTEKGAHSHTVTLHKKGLSRDQKLIKCVCTVHPQFYFKIACFLYPWLVTNVIWPTKTDQYDLKHHQRIPSDILARGNFPDLWNVQQNFPVYLL